MKPTKIPKTSGIKTKSFIYTNPTESTQLEQIIESYNEDKQET